MRICKICNKQFASSKSLSNHFRWHDLPQYKNFQIAYITHRIGKKHTLETRKKISIANFGDKNGLWRGDNVGLHGLHTRISRRLKNTDVCWNCKKSFKKLDLANISGFYKTNIDDWEWLCRRCHMTKDGRLFAKKNGKFISRR